MHNTYRTSNKKKMKIKKKKRNFNQNDKRNNKMSRKI